MATRPPDVPMRPIAAVRVLRPVDLANFFVTWEGLTLQRSQAGLPLPDPSVGGLSHENGNRGKAAPPKLVADGTAGHLIVEFPFQHVGEFATLTDKATPDLQPPVPARAANPSRLVYAVPAGTEIDFSTEGLLDAMATLALEVAPVATPAPEFTRFPGSFTPVGGTGSLVGTLLGTATSTGVDSIVTAPGGKPAVAPALVEAQRGLVAANRLILSRVLTAPGRVPTLGPAQTEPIATGPIARDPGRVFTPTGPVFTVIPRPHAPTSHETAIEAPFRLILSPSARGAWVHARKPVGVAPGDLSRVELWHSRLAVRTKDGADEIDQDQRIVRAIWTRDRDRKKPTDPFPLLPSVSDRELIVAQTSGTDAAPKATATPVRVRRLALSSLGAWLDLHAQFQSIDHYLPGLPGALTSWDQVSPMGRDQFIRIVKPGYLYPLGHAAYLVEIRYRKVVASPPQAALFSRLYIVLGDPDRSFSRIDLPFVSAHLGPLRTPDLQPPAGGPDTPVFWPTVVGASQPLAWKIDANDHDGDIVHLNAPLLFVRPTATQAQIDAALAQLPSAMTVDAKGQTVAFAPALADSQATPGSDGARASAEARTLHWSGVHKVTTADPFLAGAEIKVPAIQRLTPSANPESVGYPQVYKDHGFGAANVGNVFLEFDSPSALTFGSSERSGGFIQPDVAVAGLARSTGLVGDVGDAAAGTFDPAKLFGAGLPKLFGLFSLADLVPGGLLSLAPKFVTEELDRVAALLKDLKSLVDAVSSASLEPWQSQLPAHVTAVETAVGNLLAADGPPAQAALDALKAELQQISTLVTDLDAKVPGLIIAPFARAQLDKLTAALKPALDAAKLLDLLAAITQFVQGLNPGGGQFRTHLEWSPKLKSSAVITFDDPLKLSIDARAGAGQAAAVDIAAELTNFHLNLLPGAALMRLDFDRLAFRSSGARKPEIDVVFGGIGFVGLLSFIDVLRKVIPLDGFSDPPFVDVSTDGISAGFTLAIPNVAIGVFSLTNVSLGADARVPFLGQSISVGFNFCTRERPFTLAVFPLGGGGFVGLRLDPTGMILLEMALEFGACVALDFGVASGSVSAMGGVYIRLEGPAGSLTGYFRIRGEVDVLSLISASIELYMALTYAFDTGKMVGEATLTVHVSVLFFSCSVSIHAQRQFAGSNGDPTARQMLLPSGGTVSESWNLYCAAFADEAGA